MKLKTAFVELDTIREKIGAELVPYQSTSEWQGIDKRKILEKLRSKEGLEGNIEDIDFENGISKYYDEVVLIYIRDQFPFNEYGGEKEYKFHFSKCQTLSTFIRQEKYDRYVFTQRRDGIFVVNFFYSNGYIKKNHETKMKPCKNCLKNTNYKNYGKGRISGKYDKSNTYDNSVYNNFDIKEFFEIYIHQEEVIKPRHTPETAPIDVSYPKDWKSISKMKKDNENYICAECKIDFKDTDFLQTHHIDGRPSNNNSQNLKVLCICCHAKQGGTGHDQLKSQANYRLCLEFRKRKGIY